MLKNYALRKRFLCKMTKQFSSRSLPLRVTLLISHLEHDSSQADQGRWGWIIFFTMELGKGRVNQYTS